MKVKGRACGLPFQLSASDSDPALECTTAFTRASAASGFGAGRFISFARMPRQLRKAHFRAADHHINSAFRSGTHCAGILRELLTNGLFDNARPAKPQSGAFAWRCFRDRPASQNWRKRRPLSDRSIPKCRQTTFLHFRQLAPPPRFRHLHQRHQRFCTRAAGSRAGNTQFNGQSYYLPAPAFNGANGVRQRQDPIEPPMNANLQTRRRQPPAHQP